MTGITILGSTGSVGGSTLDVIALHKDKFKVKALTANRNVQSMLQQCIRWDPEYAVMVNEDAANELDNALHGVEVSTKVLSGVANLEEVCRLKDCDVVMAAIVGAAGLLPTLEGVRCGKRVLLANKEALVMSGSVFMDAVQTHGAQLLPIDSEHNALFQCMPAGYQAGGSGALGVEKLILTASGGPFRETPLEQLAEVTPQQACQHPNWNMGRKISVDSATMMNKGLEIIEACWLFNMPSSQIDVVIHPQSVIHSLVSYVDGSLLAQLGTPDMKIPIANALTWPDRLTSGAEQLNLAECAHLDFSPPDVSRFPCLQLARQALEIGGTAPAILNAANEVATQGFLQNELKFTQIPVIIEKTLAQVTHHQALSLEPILADDKLARQQALELKNAL